jgi:DNA recombination protein RmuC
MIQIGETTYSFSDPIVLAAMAAAGVLLLIVILLIMAVRAAGRSANLAAPLARQVNDLGQRVQGLSDGQQQLAGGLNHVSEAQSAAQSNMLQLMEKRLAQVSGQMNENLQGSARRTAQTLGELQQRLTAIDKAQENITKLSGDVLTLQDILSVEWKAGRLPDPPAQSPRTHLHRQ